MTEYHMVRGTNLSPDLQREVLGAYVYRFTGNHKPAWARQPRPDGTAYQPQFADDADWLAHTDFPLTKSGKLGRGKDAFCYSRPTWPHSPELRSHKSE